MLNSPPAGDPGVPAASPEQAPAPSSPQPVDRGPESAGSEYATPGSASGPAPQSAPQPPPAAPSGPPPQVAAIQQAYGQIQQMEQALGVLEQQDARMMAYGAQLPEAMANDLQQRAAAMPYARRELAMAKQALELQAQKEGLEGPARHVIQTFLTEQALAQVPGLDRDDFYQRLSQVKAPDDVPIVAQSMVDMHRKFGGANAAVSSSTAARLRNGVDAMGGPGGAGGADFSRMSETQLYELGIKQSDARRGQQRR